MGAPKVFRAIDKLLLVQKVLREWMFVLDPFEIVALLFVLDRTILWGKLSERVKLAHFLHGIPGTTNGVQMSRAKLIRVLNDLVQRGAIIRVRARDGDVLGVNFDWAPEEGEDDMLREPKKARSDRDGGLAEPRKVRGGSTVETSAVHGEDPWGLPEIPHKNMTSELSDYELNDSASGEPSRGHSDLIGSIERAKEKGATRRSAKLERARQSTDPAGLYLFWESAWQDTFPTTVCPVWSPRERGQAKTFASAHKFGAEPATAFFDWVVRNWTMIVQTRFWWMVEKPAPQYPAIGFVVGVKGMVFEAWNDRATLHHEMNLSAEQRQVRRLMREGRTHEDATAEVARLGKVAEEGTRLRQERQELGLEARALARDRMRFRATASGALPAPDVAPMPTIKEDAHQQDGTIATLPKGGTDADWL